jgi:hypothetical protein
VREEGRLIGAALRGKFETAHTERSHKVIKLSTVKERAKVILRASSIWRPADCFRR